MTTIIRFIAGIAWVVGSYLVWVIPCSLLFFGMDYLERHGVLRVPRIADTVCGTIPIAGIFIILPVTAVLAIRGKLPWTGQKQEGDEMNVPPDDDQ